jgi:hypothetical protein
MTPATISLSNCRGAANRACRAPSPSLISSVARPLSLRTDFAQENLSHSFRGGSSSSPVVCEAEGCAEVLTDDFAGGGLGFAQPEHPAAGEALLELGLSTTKYLRIFSRRFGPRPRIASKSSTLLNGPYDLRICSIFSAVEGPIPGTSCNSSDVAALMLTGCTGGFFWRTQKYRTVGKQLEKRELRKTATPWRVYNALNTSLDQQ